MPPACFSRFPLLMPWKFKITKKKRYERLPENEGTVISATTEYKSGLEDRVREENSEAILSEKPSVAIPTVTKYYITAAEKQALMLLKSATTSDLSIQSAIGIVLEIIEACEKLSALELKVKELQDPMVDIIDDLTSKNEEGSEVFVKAAKCIQRGIKDLLSTFRAIDEEFGEFTAQIPWLLWIYCDFKTNAVDDCLSRLSTTPEKFKLVNALRNSDFLLELHARSAKIENLVQQVVNKVDDLHEDMKNFAEARESATLRSSDIVVQQMPLTPMVFHGRDDIIEEITQLLMKEITCRVCILGSGGIGKTSVSLGVVEHPVIKARFLPENLVWVPCVEATSANLLLDILYVQLQPEGPRNEQVTIEKIISLLDTSTQPRLILLDNFETPYNALDGSQKQVEDILRRLATVSHVAVLVTMRGIHAPCDDVIQWQSKIIGPTDEAACLRIYHTISPSSKNDPDVVTLVRVLGHVPFAITLMARLAEESWSTPARELLLAWSEGGIDIFPNYWHSGYLSPVKSLNDSLTVPSFCPPPSNEDEETDHFLP